MFWWLLNVPVPSPGKSSANVLSWPVLKFGFYLTFSGFATPRFERDAPPYRGTQQGNLDRDRPDWSWTARPDEVAERIQDFRENSLPRPINGLRVP
jgi:hypothetical protein